MMLSALCEERGTRDELSKKYPFKAASEPCRGQRRTFDHASIYSHTTRVRFLRACPSGCRIAIALCNGPFHFVCFYAGKGLPLTDVVANKRYARSVLLSNTNMTPETVDALLESRVNVPAVLHVLGSGMKQKSRRDCNVDTLSSYIMLEDARVLQTVADSLCSLSHEQQENLMKELQSVFDYGKVMKLVSQVVKSLGLDDFSLAMEKVGGMVTAFGSISEQMPSDFSGSLDALRALIQDFTDQQLNVDLLKAVWDDVGQVVPSPERELVNTIMEWISGSTGQIGPPNYGLDTPVSTSTPPSREGTLGNVLNTAVKLVNDFQSPSGTGVKGRPLLPCALRLRQVHYHTGNA
ncbi:hypothetical protein MRX96_026986 [Rhipicephalus microplus]